MTSASNNGKKNTVVFMKVKKALVRTLTFFELLSNLSESLIISPELAEIKINE